MWILIFIFGLILSILMKISSEKNSSWNTIIFDIIRLFTSQDVNFVKFKELIENVENRTKSIFVIITLIFFSFIITKCLTSLLLNSYFKFIKVPYVDSLEQIIDEDICLIATKNRSFQYLINYQVFDESKIKMLRDKKDKYEKINKINMEDKNSVYDEAVFNDMVKGKVIILENSAGIKYIIDYYKEEIDSFVVSQHKYIIQLGGHPINKRSLMKEQQIFGFVSSFFYFSKKKNISEWNI